MNGPRWDSDSHILSDEEIELYIKGNREDIDRLLLKSINQLSARILPHVAQEHVQTSEWEQVLDRLGGMKKLEERANYVDCLLEKTRARTAAWQKIADSTILWTLVIVLGFLAKSVFEYVLAEIKRRIFG